jgi:DNA-binding response OmpR family regulator
MILERDSELVEALSVRAARCGWESHVLSSPTTRRVLARMRIHALLVDPAAIGSDPWGWIARVADGLPGLAVVVCAGPSTVEERVQALQSGVDDWLEKSLDPDEVIARIASAVRRRQQGVLAADAPAVLAGELEIRPEVRQAFVGDTSARLTRREFGVLQVLAAHEGVVVERETLYARVWGYAMVPGDRSVDVYVRKLRSKLQLVSPAWSYIHTQFRIGYRFQPERLAGGADHDGTPDDSDATRHREGCGHREIPGVLALASGFASKRYPTPAWV